jgi:hypothetical protein
MRLKTTKEIWKYIPGLEKRYQVSNLGRMRRGSTPAKATKPFQILNIRTDKHGYYCCDIYAKGDGTFRRLRVHRLELFAFRGNPKEGQYCTRHLNDIKTDNRLCNLKWGNQSDNCKDFYRNGGIRGFNNPRVMRKCLKSRGLL